MNDLSVATQRPTYARYGVLGFACVLSMITYLDRVCFGTVAPFIQTEFDLSNSQLGWLFTSFALAYAAFEVPTGWLGDMFGPRRTLIRIVLWWSVFTALTGLIFPVAAWPGFAFTAMLLVRFFFGVGEAGAYPNLARALHNWFPFTERGSAQGAVWMAGRFGGGVTPYVVMALLVTVILPGGQHVTYWRHIFWIFGLIGVVWCVVFYFWFRDYPEQHPSVNQAELDVIRADEPPPLPVLTPEGEKIAGKWSSAPRTAEAIQGPGHIEPGLAETEPPIPDPAPPLEEAVTGEARAAGPGGVPGLQAPA